MHFVVFQKRNATAEFVVMAEVQYLVNEVSPRFIGRVGLAGEDELDRPPAVLEERLQPFQVSEEQGRPFVRREPPSEANGQSLGIQERAACDHLRGLKMSMHPADPGSFSDEPHQFPLHRLSDCPQLVVGHVHHPLPHGRIIAGVGPARAERLAVQMVQLRRDPRRRMNAVGHAADGDLVGRQPRPEVLPHLS